jgi:hypothetical protein
METRRTPRHYQAGNMIGNGGYNGGRATKKEEERHHNATIPNRKEIHHITHTI